MAEGEAAIILVCPCGMRLRAPGARPGRVGRCPKCGGTLRAPDAAKPPRIEAEKPVEPKPRPRVNEPPRPAPEAEIPRPEAPRKKAPPAPILYGTGAPAPSDHPAEEALPPRAGMTPERREELAAAARAVGRGGVMPLPKGSKFGLIDALRYPLWDGAGLSWLVVLPVGLAGTSMVVFGLIPVVMRGGEMLVLGPFAFPMTITFAIAVGYLFQVLSAIIAGSAQNEVHHPRWPEVAFGPIVVGLFQWICAGAIGFGLSSVPAIAFARAHDLNETANALILAGIIGTGLIYTLMALAAIVLHGDPMAANPLTVAKGIVRGGLPYLQTCCAAIAAAVIATWTVRTFYRFEGVGSAILGAWGSCAVIVYLMMVVARMLGMCCFVRSSQLGWFPDRPRWGAGGPS